MAYFEARVRVGGKPKGANRLECGLASWFLYLGHAAGRCTEARSMRAVTSHGRGEKASGPGDIGKAPGSVLQVDI